MMCAPINLNEKYFDFDFQKVEDVLVQECSTVFKEILSHTEGNIYCLCLYYTGSSFSYLFPTYNTEELLEEQSLCCDPSDPLSQEQRALSYRWSPSDFTDHGDNESLSDSADELLTEISVFTETVSNIDDDYAAARRFHKAITQRVLVALQRVTEQDFIRQIWGKRKFLVINLLCGDQSNEQIVQNSKLIGNPQWMIDTLTRELKRATELFELSINSRLSVEKPDIAIKELLPWVDRYQPSFEFVNEELIVLPQHTVRYVGDNIIVSEYANNCLQVLDLLIDHPRHLEIFHYYGSLAFLGCKSGDLLFEFGRAVAKKLFEALHLTYPKRCYLVILQGDNPVMIRVCRQSKVKCQRLLDDLYLSSLNKDIDMLVFENL